VDALDTDHSFATWRDLLDELVHGPHLNWIYRGQSEGAWGLETALERTFRFTAPERRGDPLRVERGIQRRFMDRATAYLSRVPDEHDELSWLTLMQHYGAPTRLLDWTKSPLIGLYFAYENEPPPGSESRALWGLQAFSCRMQFGTRLGFNLRDPFGLVRHQTYNQQGELIEDSHPGADFDWLADENRNLQWLRDQQIKIPYPVMPPSLDDRMNAQQAFFTYDAALDGGIPRDLALPATVIGDTGASAVGWPVLKKITLPHEWRLDVLTALRKMGVTAAALFPGLDGLGRAARLSAYLPDELEDQLGA
jgi:hypothetical protein